MILLLLLLQLSVCIMLTHFCIEPFDIAGENFVGQLHFLCPANCQNKEGIIIIAIIAVNMK